MLKPNLIISMRKTILVAEEDEIEFYKEAIFNTYLPVDIVSVGTCDEIFDAIKRVLPDMVVIDGHMPNKAVDECISAIRSDLKLQSVPLIVLSGTLKVNSLGNYYKAGISLYLTKPASIKD